jgi:hypothetical protein
VEWPNDRLIRNIRKNIDMFGNTNDKYEHKWNITGEVALKNSETEAKVEIKR